jgi:hypothetical protein
VLLRNDAGIAVRASPKASFREKCPKTSQGVHGKARGPQLHGRAESAIGHPGRHFQHDPWIYFDVQDAAVGALLAAIQSQAAAVIRVPAIADFNFLADMGRMTL